MDDRSSTRRGTAAPAVSIDVAGQEAPAGNRSIDRAFRLLALLVQRPMRLGELAQSAGLAKSTTSRLVATLAGLGAVSVNDAMIRIGPLISALAFGAEDDRDVLRSASSSALRSLAEDVGEHAALAISEGDDVVYLDQQHGSVSAVEAGDWTGHRHATHGTAFGLALMAFWDEGRVDRYLTEPLAAFTPATVTDPDLLREALCVVQEEGLVWTVDQFAEDVTGCAAPVRGRDGRVVASIGCFAPTYRFPGVGSDAAEEVGRRVQVAASELSAALGSVGPV